MVNTVGMQWFRGSLTSTQKFTITSYVLYLAPLSLVQSAFYSTVP